MMRAAGVDQPTLAKRVGVSQPTINRLLTGEQTGSKHMHRIARELRTTPEYLLGESDEPSPVSEGHFLSDEEEQLLKDYRSMSEENRAATLKVIQFYAGRSED